MKDQRLFIGLFPCGFSYADTAREEHGDYMQVAFMSYATLELEIKKPKSPLLAEVRAHAATIQARAGESYAIAGNLSITLGGRK